MSHFPKLITHEQYIIAKLSTYHVKKTSLLKTRCDDGCGVLNSECVSSGQIIFIKTSCCISQSVYINVSVFLNLYVFISFMVLWKINKVGWRQKQGLILPYMTGWWKPHFYTNIIIEPYCVCSLRKNIWIPSSQVTTVLPGEIPQQLHH